MTSGCKDIRIRKLAFEVVVQHGSWNLGVQFTQFYSNTLSSTIGGNREMDQ